MKIINHWNISKGWKPYCISDEEIDEAYRNGECSFTSKQINDIMKEIKRGKLK